MGVLPARMSGNPVYAWCLRSEEVLHPLILELQTAIVRSISVLSMEPLLQHLKDADFKCGGWRLKYE